MSHPDDAELDTTHRFLLAGLRAHWDPPALKAAVRLAETGIDWQRWLRLIRGQRLSPLLYYNLRGTHLLPATVENAMRQEYLQTALRSTLLLTELGLMLAELQSAAVRAMPVKGALLAETVYASRTVRPMADLDLVVMPADAEAAHAALADLGYAMDSPEPWPGYTRRYRQAVELRRTGGEYLEPLVDLHWGVVDVPFYERIPLESWFERGGTALLGGVRSRIPSPEDHFLLLCSHLALHERYSSDLLRLCDLAASIHQAGEKLSWDRVIRRSVDWQLVLPLRRAVRQLAVFWPGTVPAPIERDVARLRPSPAEERIHRWLVDRRRNPSSDVLLFVSTAKGARRKVRLLLEQAFPSPSYMRQRYALRQTGLLPLAYARRIGLMFLNLAGRHG